MSTTVELPELVANRVMLNALIGHFAMAYQESGKGTAEDWLAEFRGDCLRFADGAQFEGSSLVSRRELIEETKTCITQALAGLRFGK